jgi:hypothetical protein
MLVLERFWFGMLNSPVLCFPRFIHGFNKQMIYLNRENKKQMGKVELLNVINLVYMNFGKKTKKRIIHLDESYDKEDVEEDFGALDL